MPDIEGVIQENRFEGKISNVSIWGGVAGGMLAGALLLNTCAGTDLSPEDVDPSELVRIDFVTKDGTNCSALQVERDSVDGVLVGTIDCEFFVRD